MEQTSESVTVARDRSVPHKRPFALALLATGVHYLALLVLLGAVLLFVIRRDLPGAQVLGAAAAFCGLSWVIAFMKRRAARCPLCKGTPYLDTGARTHRKATRIPPFNHGTSAVLSSLFTQRFRCMFCGSRYDLLKPSSSRRR
jgi:hypothetical protein